MTKDQSGESRYKIFEIVLLAEWEVELRGLNSLIFNAIGPHCWSARRGKEIKIVVERDKGRKKKKKGKKKKKKER